VPTAGVKSALAVENLLDSRHLRGSYEQEIYNYLWPNFMVNLYPGHGNASTNIILPLAPDRTLAIYDLYFEEGVREESTTVAFIDQVQREDVIICESVQRGLGSGFYDQGRLMTRCEQGIQHFERLVFEALTGPERRQGPSDRRGKGQHGGNRPRPGGRRSGDPSGHTPGFPQHEEHAAGGRGRAERPAGA
jgi:hypothetical protein